MTFCQMYGHYFVATLNTSWVQCKHCQFLRREAKP